MKKLLKSVLPVPVWNFLRAVKIKLITLKVRCKIMLGLPLKKERNKIRFEIHITEHCNLNCMGCNNFSCIAEPEFIDVEEFRRDFSRMGELFGHECERIYLLGGEPLLHPEIASIVKIARDSFSEGKIFVFTNGILLSSKTADFWEACRDNNVGILISAYPIKIDTDKIKFLADKYGVSVNWAWNQNAHERDMFTISSIDLAGQGNIELNFAMCGRANNCITLKHGRLYTCVFAPHVEHFNKYFKQNVNITEADGINIYEANNSEEIFRKLVKPIPACRYCTPLKPARSIHWGVTRKEISEWL